eukprot:TRINITY_DN7372_c0_g4_i2.p1 TRINITY_DN7372_c0_g4~~TRINITY_DN7372_c0_g4_i2.p1  ORF type:complete len:747 (-),score=56.30 TRINITY_DN7372_c0_g4_i2:81-2321(-)
MSLVCGWILAALCLHIICFGLRKDSPRSLESDRLQVCHQSIVKETCQNWNGELEVDPSNGTTSVTLDALSDLLSTNKHDMKNVWNALGLTADQQEVSCQSLCDKLVTYVEAVGGVLPPSSDTVCITIAGTTSCDTYVDPIQLVTDMDSLDIETHPIDQGPLLADSDDNSSDESLGASEAAPALVGARFGNSYVTQAQNSNVTSIIYSVWDAVESIAEQFRFYPSSGSDNIVLHGPPDDNDSAFLDVSASGFVNRSVVSTQKLNTNFARAKTWVSRVRAVMHAQQAASVRARYFGGNPRVRSDEAVRKRLISTFNFVGLELRQGVHFVYPADSAHKSPCAAASAYVWRQRRSALDYIQNDGPRCSPHDDPKTKNCGVDTSGKYYVYLCSNLFGSSDTYFTGVLIHELVHHTGPGDHIMSDQAAKVLSQTKQLDNAANYQYFARDIFAGGGGCVDTDPNCAQHYRQYCSTQEHIRKICRSTCGLCNGPSIPSNLPEPPLTQSPPVSRPGPRPSPQPSGEGSACFPPNAGVLLAPAYGAVDAAETSIQSLLPGDGLLGSDGELNTYLLDFHGGVAERKTLMTTYLRIEHDLQKPGRPLLVTANHLVFVTHAEQKTKSMPAGEIRPGEHALLVSGTSRELMPSVVRSVEAVSLPGFAAPLTSSGQLFVEHVLVSSYALLSEAQFTLWQKGPTMFRDETQRICHMVAFPFRFAHAFGLGALYLDIVSMTFDRLSALLLFLTGSGCHSAFTL